MAAPRYKPTREEEELEKQERFRKSAFMVIEEMAELNKQKPPSVFMDEALHSIFFLGKITNPKFTPDSIVDNDKDIVRALERRYPRPFQYYGSQLPRRSPFSCVLDMVVNLKGQQNEPAIKQKLQEIIRTLKESEAEALVSSTICISQPDKTLQSSRHYGVSMSTSGRDPGRIIVAAACFSNWDKYVADAVITYYPSKTKKRYFDGTIKLPKEVRCAAFSLGGGEPMAPCRSCGNMFGLDTTEKQVWAYGNCAEAESVSNLLKVDKEVREQVSQPSKTCTDANRTRAIGEVNAELRRCLGNEFQWDGNFYTPQV